MEGERWSVTLAIVTPRETYAEQKNFQYRMASLRRTFILPGCIFLEKTIKNVEVPTQVSSIAFFLPVLIRDQLPRVRNGIVLLASALRRLDGQAYSHESAKGLGILPGSRAISHKEIDAIHGDLIIALVLIEGSFPVGHLIPSMHHFVHYAQYTKTHGILRSYWMMAFERSVRAPCV